MKKLLSIILAVIMTVSTSTLVLAAQEENTPEESTSVSVETTKDYQVYEQTTGNFYDDLDDEKKESIDNINQVIRESSAVLKVIAEKLKALIDSFLDFFNRISDTFYKSVKK